PFGTLPAELSSTQFLSRLNTPPLILHFFPATKILSRWAALHFDSVWATGQSSSLRTCFFDYRRDPIRNCHPRVWIGNKLKVRQQRQSVHCNRCCHHEKQDATNTSMLCL